MMDMLLGLIIVSCCIGSLFGAVYGWLAFGTVVFVSGFIEFVGNSIKGKK